MVRNKLNRRNFLKLFCGAAAGVVVTTRPQPELEPEPEPKTKACERLEEEIVAYWGGPLGNYSSAWQTPDGVVHYA
jgi:hypothetical protein